LVNNQLNTRQELPGGKVISTRTLRPRTRQTDIKDHLSLTPRGPPAPPRAAAAAAESPVADTAPA
jgi:hypothetical protein